jgi:hypothetical protein
MMDNVVYHRHGNQNCLAMSKQMSQPTVAD